ncbi:MAG: hypothetical protein U0U66_04665 [Cytophagaceae bacterium]
MKELSSDWLTQGLVDYEYKKYLILSYLKSIREDYDAFRLYPSLSDLYYHYTNLKLFVDSKSKISQQFPKTMTKADFENFQIEYTSLIPDTEIDKILDEIIEFTMPRFENGLQEGKHMFEEVESKVTLEPLGILPLYKDAGYLLVFPKVVNQVQVYVYETTVFLRSDATYKGMHLNHLETFQPTFSYTIESKKRDLIKQRPDLPNPATYLAEVDFPYPEKETLLPVVQRMLLRAIKE